MISWPSNGGPFCRWIGELAYRPRANDDRLLLTCAIESRPAAVPDAYSISSREPFNQLAEVQHEEGRSSGAAAHGARHAVAQTQFSG